MAQAPQSAASRAQQALAMNQALRNLLLSSAPRMRKNLGTFTGNGMGSTTRIPLFNVGLITNIQLSVSCAIAISTAVGVPSPRAPYNLISRVRLTDYDGTDRVNWSGFQLFVLNCVRNRIPYGINNEGPIVTTNGSSVLSGIVSNPNTPTLVGGSFISFVLDVPVAYDPEADLRGCILGQTAVGQMTLSIDWAPTLYANGNLDAVYSGGGTTVVTLNGVAGPSVTVWQEYLMPQTVQGQVPLPTIDLQTVYECAGNIRDNANLAVGSEKLIPYPNVRSVIGAYFAYMNGSVMLATDIGQFRLIANGNNILRDDNQLTQIIRQRNYLEGDIAFGTYFFLHRSKPIETALYGNIQAGITPTTVNSNAQIEFGFESFYVKGSALPGITQS
jgi:hypothetical protein